MSTNLGPTTRAPRPYDRTTHNGVTVDWLTRAALIAAEQMLGRPLQLVQGSYNAGGVGASAGTHDGGGVVDGAESSPAAYATVVRVLRRLGFAAWHRVELWRNGVRVWREHWHAVLIGNRRLSAAALVQVAEYLAGYDGLAGNGRDPGPREFTANRFSWRVGARRITRAAALLARADALLATGVRGYPRAAKARRKLARAMRQLGAIE